jgi:hypothetical protein
MGVSMACVSVGAVSAAEQALADLAEISSQVRSAVIFDERGEIAASTIGEEHAGAFVRAVQDLVAAAGETSGGGERLAQLEAATAEGSVFVVRDGPRFVAAATGPEPTVALVFYDLKTALRAAASEPEQAPKPKKKPRRAPKKQTGEGGDAA